MIIPIIFIGPMATGKSTLGKHLSEKLNLNQFPMDMIRWYYYFKKGYTLKTDRDCESFADRLNYWKPFEVNAVEKIVNEFKEGIIDFGAGHAHFEKKEHIDRVSKALKNIPNIFFILPDQDLNVSEQICLKRLEERKGKPPSKDEIEANKEFIHSNSFRLLAKHTFYTNGKTPEECANEIIPLLV